MLWGKLQTLRSVIHPSKSSCVLTLAHHCVFHGCQRSTCWVWCERSEPLTGAALTLHDTLLWLFDHLASQCVQSTVHLFLFSHYPSISATCCWLYSTCSVACLWPMAPWIRVQQGLNDSPDPPPPPTHIHTQMHILHMTTCSTQEPIHVRVRQADTKETEVHNKCEFWESDIVIQAITYFTSIAGYCVCMWTHTKELCMKRTHNRNTHTHIHTHNYIYTHSWKLSLSQMQWHIPRLTVKWISKVSDILKTEPTIEYIE